MNKVTIIGAGSVGSTIAYTLAVAGLASEIVLIDINEKKAFGEAMDIRQGTPFCSPCFIYSGGYEDAKNSDIVIVTSGIARKAGQSRLDLAQIYDRVAERCQAVCVGSAKPEPGHQGGEGVPALDAGAVTFIAPVVKAYCRQFFHGRFFSGLGLSLASAGAYCRESKRREKSKIGYFHQYFIL